MTTLSLDYNQRLNIIAMLDALEVQGRREGFAICALQERIDLTDEERTAIGWRKNALSDGREYITWHAANGSAAQNYELTETDIARIIRAVDNYRVVMGRDGLWWKPLVAQLPALEEANGNKP